MAGPVVEVGCGFVTRMLDRRSLPLLRSVPIQAGEDLQLWPPGSGSRGCSNVCPGGRRSSSSTTTGSATRSEDPYEPRPDRGHSAGVRRSDGCARRGRIALTELAEVQELVQHPERLRHCLVLVTLDDGYRDNYDVALPHPAVARSTAAFFLATGFVGTHGTFLWWDQVAFMIRHTEKRQFPRLHYPWEESIDLDEAPTRQGHRRPS